MKIQKTILLLFLLFSTLLIVGQEYNPYQRFDKNVNVLTFSNGKYNEFFDTDTIEIIGSAVLNTKTMKVIGFIENEVQYSESTLEPEVVSRWLSIDPLASKFPYESPYVFVGNSPLIYVDTDGREKIVVTGGEYDGRRYKYNFIEPSIHQLKKYTAKAVEEEVTWLIMNVGYSTKDIASFKSTAEELGVKLVLVNSADELSTYLNKKSTSIPEGEAQKTVSEDRSKDLVSEVTTFGHGLVGSMSFGYHQTEEEQTAFSYGIDDTKNLNPNAFTEEASFDIYTCNSATLLPKSGTSMMIELSRNTETKVNGYLGRTEYAKMNIGEGYSDKMNRRYYGYNTNGSLRLPTGGFQNNSEAPSEKRSYETKQSPNNPSKSQGKTKF
jgi:hypothetical protein